MTKHFDISLKVLALFLSMLSWTAIHAEGTKELQPAATDYGFLQIFDQNTITRPFATFDAPEEYRLNISVCNLGEKIFMGFRQNDNDVYFRLKDPNGNTVMGPTLIPGSGQGFIENHADAVSGPLQITGDGYYALEYSPTMTGDYYIEFNPTSPTDITPQKRVFNFVDFTVADTTGATPEVKTGRLYSKNWDIQCMSDQNPFKAEMYVYAKDSIVTSLDFNNINGFGFTIAANSKGCIDSGDPVADRQSRYGNYTFPEYKLFLNNPDPECYPSGNFGEITQPTTITGCDPENRCINVYVNKGGTVEIILELNGVEGYQTNSEDVIFQVDVVAGHNCIKWDTRNGLGKLVAPGTEMNITVNYFNGLTHLPLFDVEHHRDGYVVNLVRPFPPSGVTKPQLFWDDSRLDPGRGNALDEMVKLDGCNLDGCHKWENRGVNGPYMETINTWWYANLIKDDLGYIVREITVDANDNTPLDAPNDTTVCVSSLPLNLNGKVTGATGGIWSYGGGTFSSLTDLLGTYMPTQDEIDAELATIVLTSTGNGDCPPVSDSMDIYIQPLPIVDPGDPLDVCINNPVFTLNGSVQNAEGVLWSGGNGQVFPNRQSLEITYSPSSDELSQGFVTLTLESTGNGLCEAVSEDIIINFTPAPEIGAGGEIEVCANNPEINLEGSISGADGGRWVGGNGNFSEGRDTLFTTYTPTDAEIANGTLLLFLESTGNGSCIGVRDTLHITFIPSPSVNAGPDRTVCPNTPVSLSGLVSGVNKGYWTGGSGTFSPDSTSLNATYLPSPEENISGSNITLTLTSPALNNCEAVSDELVINIGDGPGANAGPDQIICGNNPVATLSGIVSMASGGLWSGGSGYFTPHRNALNATYHPSQQEIESSVIALQLSTTGNDTCGAGRDTVLIFISPSPEVEAGEDQTLCANNAEIQLNGSTISATGSFWTGGQGVFTPNASTLDAKYIPSQNEINRGYLELRLNATKASCKAVEDVVRFYFTRSPEANTGPSVNVCENNPEANVYGYVIQATGGIWSGGQGTYSPSATSMNIKYTPTQKEINDGGVTLTLTTTGNGNCLEEKDSLNISFTPAPVVNAGPDQFVCINNPIVEVSGSVSGAGRGFWSGGQGYFTPGPHALNAKYTPSQNELNNGFVRLILSSMDNGNCNPSSDTLDIFITPPPSIDAGPEKEICAVDPEVGLTANISGASGVFWSGGEGDFTPEDGISTIYRPSIKEINQGFVFLTATSTGNGACNSVEDNVRVNFVKAPSVNAGPDQLICGTETRFFLNKGSATNSSGVQWTSSGSGTFTPNSTTLSPGYNISEEDKEVGTLSIILTSTGNSLCPEASDTVQITFTPVPVINAGPDRDICTNALPINLLAKGTPANWSGGQGTFIPSREVMNPQYLPSQGELRSGRVELTAFTLPNGSCPSVEDKVIVSFIEGPEVNIGPDQIVCGNSSSIELSALTQNASGVLWATSGGGNISPDSYSQNISYYFSENDKLSDTIYFYASTTDNGNCPGEKDTLLVSLTPEVIVNAGPDQSFCGDIDEIDLSGSISNASGATWTSLGTGTFNNSSTLSTAYKPSTGDISNGSVLLILSTQATENCPPVNDTVRITFTPTPTINAGPDQEICASEEFIELNGSMTVATEALWTSNGKGTFAPNAFEITNQYYLHPEDQNLSKLELILTSTSQGDCKPVSDTLNISIRPLPVVEAGPDIQACKSNSAINLEGALLNAQGGTWSTQGLGSFGSPTALSTTFSPDAQDLDKESVILTLESTGTGVCPPVSDFLEIRFIEPPMLSVSPDQNLCISTEEVRLLGSGEDFSSANWTTNGNGSFNGTENNLEATYSFSATDKSLSSIEFTLSINGNADCPAESLSTTVEFTKLPLVDAGDDVEVCGDTSYIQLNASTQNSIEGIWNTNGSGSFFPNRNDPAAGYTPSVADISAGSVSLIYTAFSTGPCPAESDTVFISINPVTISNAGADITVCSNTEQISLQGTVEHASGGKWSTSGSGIFLPSAEDLNASYIPSASDTAVGTVILNLETTGNGLCKENRDYLELTFTPLPYVDLGPDRTLCENIASINIPANVMNGNGGIWSHSGTGNLSPGITSLNPDYIFSASDKQQGEVEFIYTSTDNGLCPAGSDTLMIYLNPLPVLDAGPDKTICFDELGAEFDIISGNNNIEWISEGNGYFTPNRYRPNVQYIPSNSDKLNGEVLIIARTQDDGICPVTEDSIILTITPAPTIEAGNDKRVCEDTEGIVLDGSVNNAEGGIWVSSGSGFFFPSAESMNATYYQSPEDVKAGNIKLTLISTGNNNCYPVKDSLRVRFDPIPTLDAGPDIEVCEDVSSFPLNAVLENANGVFWQSLDGDGNFDPAANLISTNYQPGPQDRIRTFINFLVTATGTGNCNAPSDNVRISFSTVPVPEAGPDRNICETDLPLKLEGSGTNAIWSGGNGTFNPGPGSLTAIYTPTPVEVSNGNLEFVLTSTGNGTCPPETDTVRFSILQGPEINATAPVEICASETSIDLQASFSNATNLLWLASGRGTISDPSQPVTSYVIDNLDRQAGSVTFTVTTVKNSICEPVSAQVTTLLRPEPIIDPGFDLSGCVDKSSYQLTSSSRNSSGIRWSGGAGTFSNPAVNNPIYTPAASDKGSGTVTLIVEALSPNICPSVQDSMQISFSAPPIAEAGPPVQLCNDKEFILLEGTITGASGGIWTSSGSGIFAPDASSLSTLYYLSETDKNLNQLRFTLTSTGNGTCNPVSDDKILQLRLAPEVTAGLLPPTVCSNEAQIPASAEITNASGILWKTNGGGSFAPSATSLNTIYSPTQAEIDNGAIVLTATSTGHSSVCQPDSQLVMIKIQASPTAVVNAGNDQTHCIDVEEISLNGKITVSKTAEWATEGDGQFIPSITSLDAIYIPGPADKSAGSVQLSLTTTDNFGCTPGSDTMEITFTPAPQVFAGPQDTICKDKAIYNLAGAVQVASGAIWTSNGSGIFSPSPNSLNTNYYISEEDKSNGSVIFTITSTGNGTCKPVSEEKILILRESPSLEAGPDQEICVTENEIVLEATLTNAGGVIWTTSGSGTFDNNNVLSPIYTISQQDKETGFVSFNVTSTQNIDCEADNDLVRVDLSPVPELNLVAANEICSDEISINLEGFAENEYTVGWSGSGTGTFSPSASINNPVYILSAEDQAQDTLEFLLVMTDDHVCNDISLNRKVAIKQAPVAVVSPISACDFEDGISLSGNVLNAGGGKWITSGNGTFSPTSFGLNTIYFPSQEDESGRNIEISFISTDNGICEADTMSSEISLTPPPVADAGEDLRICRNVPVLLKGNSNDYYSYAWTTEDGIIISTSTSAIVSTSASSLFTYTVTDQNGCQESDTIRVSAFDPPSLNLDPHYCLTDDLLLDSDPTSTSPMAGAFYWTKDRNLIPNENTPLLWVTESGLHVVVYSDGNCSVTDTSEVTSPPKIYTPGKITCTGNITRISTTNIPGLIYSWTGEDVSSGSSGYYLDYLVPSDTSLVFVSATDSRGCTKDDSAFVIGLPKPEFDIEDTSVCEGEVFVFNSRPSNIDELQAFTPAYSWFYKSTLISNADSLPVANAGLYFATVKVGECIAIDSAKLSLDPIPEVGLDKEKKYCEELDKEVVLTSRAKDVSYLWLPGNDTTKSITVYEEGVYYLEVTNVYNCRNNDSIWVRDICPPRLFAPTAITVNGDTHNDNFKVFGKYFTNYTITIFNRWGEVIYYSENPEISWDGYYRGEPMPIGVYPWIITYEGVHEEYKGPFMMEGKVSVLR